MSNPFLRDSDILNCVRELTARHLGKAFSIVFLLVCCVLLVGQTQKVSRYLDGAATVDQFRLLGLGLLGLLEVVLPISAFLAVVIVYRKLWRRGQILTLLSLGYGPVRLFRGNIYFSFVMTAAVFICTHLFGPMALQALRGEFISVFESGMIYPEAVFDLPNGGIASIPIESKNVIGILPNREGPMLLFGENGRFGTIEGKPHLEIAHVSLAGPKHSLFTQKLSISLGDNTVSAFPKVLRGRKLFPSDELNMNNDADVFVYVRRWALVLYTPFLILFAGFLPGRLSDRNVALVSALLVGGFHGYFRVLELLNVGSALIILGGAAFVSLCALAGVVGFRLTFLLAPSARVY